MSRGRRVSLFGVVLAVLAPVLERGSTMKGRLGLAVLILSFAVGTNPALAGTKTFTAAVNSDWFTAGNWSPSGIPGSSDDVVINSATAIISGQDASAGSLSINTGSPNSGGLEILDHTLTVSSSGTSTLDGFLEVDGTLNLNDPTTYEGTTNSNGINIGGTLNIGSTFTMTSADDTNHASINNTTNSSLVHVLAGGSLIRNTSAGVQTIGPPVDNDGSAASSVQTGTLNLAGGDTSSSTGGYDIGSGATLQAHGTFESPSITGSGTFDLASGTTTVGASDTFSVASLHIDGGTLTLDQDLSIPTLISTGGHRNGTGTLTVTGTADFSGLSLDTATTTVASSVPSFNIGEFLNVGSTFTGTNATLNLDTPTTYAQSSDSNGINLGGGVLNIASTFTMSGAGIQAGINDTGGSPLVHVLSTGSLIRDTSSGSVATPPIDNEGIVSVQTGTLSASGLTQGAGTLTVAAGGELDGSVVLNGGTLDGNGTLGGPLSNPGGTVAPGSSPGTLTVTGDYTQGSGGTLAEDITGTTPGTQFDRLFVGGNLSLDGTLAIQSQSFTPASTDSFKIITGASSRTGNFASLTGASVNGQTYTPQYDADGVTLLVAGAPPSETLSVAFAGSGAGSVSDGASLNCTASCQGQYPQGTVVTLTATAASGSTFAGWSGGGCSGTGTCQVTMSAAQGVTATFNAIPVVHTLTVTRAGAGSGTVSSSPSGISCGATCSASYNQGATVTLTATPASGSAFTGWSGACSGTGPCKLTITGDLSVTATFALQPVVSWPPVIRGANLFCGVQHRGRCVGLKLKTTFSGPGKAVWQFAAFNPTPGHAATGSAASKPVALGAIKRKITRPGPVRIVFKLQPGARTNRLYKQIRRRRLNAIRVTLTFTTPAGKRLVETKNIRLKR